MNNKDLVTLSPSEMVSMYTNTRQFILGERWGFDLDKGESVPISDKDPIPDNVVVYPDIEDLVSFGDLVSSFLWEKNLPIPHNHYAEYLRENDLYYEFCEYQADEQWRILRPWLVAKGILKQ